MLFFLCLSNFYWRKIPQGKRTGYVNSDRELSQGGPTCGTPTLCCPSPQPCPGAYHYLPQPLPPKARWPHGELWPRPPESRGPYSTAVALPFCVSLQVSSSIYGCQAGQTLKTDPSGPWVITRLSDNRKHKLEVNFLLRRKEHWLC